MQQDISQFKLNIIVMGTVNRNGLLSTKALQHNNVQSNNSDGGEVYALGNNIMSFGDSSYFTNKSAEQDGVGVYAWRVNTDVDNNNFTGNLYYGGCVAVEESTVDVSSSDFITTWPCTRAVSLWTHVTSS